MWRGGVCRLGNCVDKMSLEGLLTRRDGTGRVVKTGRQAYKKAGISRVKEFVGGGGEGLHSLSLQSRLLRGW